MSLIDHLVLTYYKITRLGIQKQGGEVVASYDVALYNSDGRRLETLHPSSTLTAQEETALLAIIQRDKDQFEANTGLTELPAE